jgi:hypothetical protein
MFGHPDHRAVIELHAVVDVATPDNYARFEMLWMLAVDNIDLRLFGEWRDLLSYCSVLEVNNLLCYRRIRPAVFNPLDPLTVFTLDRE